ncbi:MAG: PilN domain-containing protein [Candidatus Rokubacteria bacterium]|nr:PilN domain-containing protein [Candidatus Rokubacteria bacterium]
MTVAGHDLRGLLGRHLQSRRVVWIQRHRGTTDLLFLEGGQLQLSRSVPIGDPDEITAEIGATLDHLGWAKLRWGNADAVWVSGDDAQQFLGAPALVDLGGAVSEPPWSSVAAPLVQALPLENAGDHLLALATARVRRRPNLNLLPPEVRPRTWSTGQLVTAATVAVTAVLGLAVLLAQAHQEQRYLDRLSVAIRALDPEVREVERLANEVGQKKRVLGALRAAATGGIRPLPFLRELTDALPSDAWLSALTLDPKGVEMTGQANAASQLIPLLEASPWLERVEFTSPVTRGRDKEQFRLKAVWEPGAAQRTVPSAPSTPPAAIVPPPAPPVPPALRMRPPVAPQPGAPAPGPAAPDRLRPQRPPPPPDDEEG